MPSLKLFAVEGSAGEGASGNWTIPLGTCSPALTLSSKHTTTTAGKTFTYWSSVTGTQSVISGYMNATDIPTGWYWMHDPESGYQIKFGCQATGQVTFGPVKYAGSTIGSGASNTGSDVPDRVIVLVNKSTADGTAYYLCRGQLSSTTGGGEVRGYGMSYAVTFDGIDDLISGDSPYEPPGGGAGAGSTPGGAGDVGTGDGFPDGTPSTAITTKTERLPGFLHVYRCAEIQINGVVNAMWGGNSQSMFDSLWGKFQNYKFSPLAGIVSCHSLPGTLMPPNGLAEHIHAAGTDLSTIDIAATGSSVSSLWTHYTSSSISLGNPWASYADYSHSSISIHLPFCGIVPIDVSAVMGGSIQVTYWCDVLTGNCAAWINGTDRDGTLQLLKTATGNCAYRYPMFGNDNGTGAVISAITGMAQGTAELGGSIISGAVQAATGGGLNGLPNNFDILGSAGKNAVQFATQVATAQHHTQSVGSLNGSCGFAGSTEIFLICDWQYPVESENFTTCRGRPSEVSGAVSSYGLGTYCELEVNPISITVATNEEKEEIRKLCASGVII